MQRNINTSMELLKVVERQARLLGIALQELKQVYGEIHGGFSDNEIYQLDLLVRGGYLDKTEDSFRMTWSGHDLLDNLKRV